MFYRLKMSAMSVFAVWSKKKRRGGKRLSSSFASRTISASHHHGVHRKIRLKEQHSCYRSALNLLYAA